MKLKVNSIENKGDISTECVWIDVLEDVENLSYYLLCDTTYIDENHISNELRHLYWFPKSSVKKGDWIKLLTRDGVNSTSSNNRNTTTHILYWKLGKTVWNKDGDAAILFHLNTWNTTKA